MTRALPGNILKALLLGLLAFAIIGPLANLALWSVAERWYTPHKLPVTYGTRYWEQVFRPTGDAMASLGTSIWIAVLTVVVNETEGSSVPLADTVASIRRFVSPINVIGVPRAASGDADVSGFERMFATARLAT